MKKFDIVTDWVMLLVFFAKVVFGLRVFLNLVWEGRIPDELILDKLS